MGILTKIERMLVKECFYQEKEADKYLEFYKELEEYESKIGRNINT